MFEVQDCVCKYDNDVKDLQVIGLSRQKNDGKRFIAVGGKSEFSLLQVSNIFSDDQ